MGEVFVKVKLSNPVTGRAKVIRFLVDTGATISVVPEETLKSLHIKPVDKDNFELADGRIIERNIGNIIVEVEGRMRANSVIFGKDGDAAVLGLVTLESCGLTVDPINRKLIPLQKIHQYNYRKSEEGQILPLVALTVLVLSMFSFLVWNLGMLEFNRQKMQTATDAAAISAMRTRAAFYNAMSPMNTGTHAMCLYMFHNIKEGGMLKEMVSVYQAYISALKVLNQGAGGASYLTGYQAARLNGAERSVGTFISGGRGTGMKGRKMKFTLFKLVTLPIVGTVPIPVGRKTFNPAYYCRSWENSYRRAQPQQQMVWTAYKQNTTFAASLIGLRKPARAQAIAQAKIYLNVRENAALHNGGFPRNRNESWWGWGIEPVAFWSQFDARFVPVRGGFQH